MENKNIPGQTPEIMTRKECAAYLKICLSKLDRSECPRIKLCGRTVRYKKSDVDNWLSKLAGNATEVNQNEESL
ncbi:MAG: hypothetical protein IJJ66_01600 [Treponema sp.]|nr:hypothetical protein [Treponema sp.]